MSYYAIKEADTCSRGALLPSAAHMEWIRDVGGLSNVSEGVNDSGTRVKNMAGSGHACCLWSRRHYPTASYDDHSSLPTGPETVTSSQTVSATSPLGWGINLICMLTNRMKCKLTMKQCYCSVLVKPHGGFSVTGEASVRYEYQSFLN